MVDPRERNRALQKTVLITGASSGFGVYLAHACAHAGYAVVLAGRDEGRLRALEDVLSKKETVPCAAIVADLQTADGRGALRSAFHAHNVDIFINNAAINPELGRISGTGDLNEIDAIISTNTSAAIALCHGAFAHFIARPGGGTIININSVAGLKGSHHEALYAASKFGLRGFSESVKDAWLSQGVRMIDVYSGAIATGMSSRRADFNDLADPQELAAFLIALCATSGFFVRELNVQKTAKTREGDTEIGRTRLDAMRGDKEREREAYSVYGERLRDAGNEAVRQTRKSCEKIVFANGVFDLLHPGHIALLKFAKSLGSKLVVGINSDRATKLLKGPERPIHDERHRKTILENLSFVDEVIIFDDTKTLETVLKIKPAVIVKGGEWTVEEVRTNDEVPSSIEIVTFPVIKNSAGVKLSTSAVVEKMKQGEEANT